MLRKEFSDWLARRDSTTVIDEIFQAIRREPFLLKLFASNRQLRYIAGAFPFLLEHKVA